MTRADDPRVRHLLGLAREGATVDDVINYLLEPAWKRSVRMVMPGLAVAVALCMAMFSIVVSMVTILPGAVLLWLERFVE